MGYKLTKTLSRPPKKYTPPGYRWCRFCFKFLPLTDFNKNSGSCRLHNSRHSIKHREKKKKEQLEQSVSEYLKEYLKNNPICWAFDIYRIII